MCKKTRLGVKNLTYMSVHSLLVVLMYSYRQLGRPNANSVSLPSSESCPDKIGKFNSFKFWLPLKLTNEKDIDKVQILFFLETSSCQVWKMASSKRHSQSLNAAKFILKLVYSLDKICTDLHRTSART